MLLVDAWDPPIWLSLAVVVGVLGTAAVLSMHGGSANEGSPSGEWAAPPIGGHGRATENPFMTAAFITCATPRSMAPERAAAWLERRVALLRRRAPIAHASVRELRPRRREPVWLLHVLLASDDGDRPLGELAAEMQRLGMQPTLVVDRRARGTSAARPAESELTSSAPF